MNVADVAAEYLAVGANRQTGAVDWSQEGILAFGADRNIALWRPNDSVKRGITALLSGHTAPVKVVKFLPKIQYEPSTYMITGADDHCLRVWKIDPSASKGVCVQSVQEHSAPINCLAVLPTAAIGSSAFIFVSGAADASIKIWRFSSVGISVLQTIKTSPKYFPLALALTSLPGLQSAFVLASAGTKDTIQVFVASPDDLVPEFRHQVTLSGHEGWIRSLDFVSETDDPLSDVILASASQDKYIRLWRFHRANGPPGATSDVSHDPTAGALLPGRSLSNKAHQFSVGVDDVTVTFEALLLGHEDWIYSARWHRHARGMLQILSASADNSLSIWEADPSSGIWVTIARLGEISREKGATTATGSIGGFWTGLWSPDGKSVVTLGRTGSWRMWSYSEEQDRWIQQVAVSGHTRAVTGLSWARSGSYLLSTSADQTTRLHAQWKAGGNTWHELSRPQIHGYDLNCIDTLSDSTFVSGADEKLMRVFSEPKAVAKLLQRITGTTGTETDIDSLPAAASIPVLGLSNKAGEVTGETDAVDPSVEAELSSDVEAEAAIKTRMAMLEEATQPPFEETLSRHTLWPETEKLYGHGYELSCLATSHDGRLIASACRASSVNHAVIRLFETRRWTELRPPLPAHSLTVTRLRFAPPDDMFLLSVGRDRKWAVFEKQHRDAKGAGEEETENDDGLRYELLQSDPKGHARMILDAAWAPSLQPRVFATAGRDKQVKIWSRYESLGGGDRTNSRGGFILATNVTLDKPVTALDFLPRQSSQKDGNLVLAVGTEDGKTRIVRLRTDPDEVVVASISEIPSELSLPTAVLQLAWRPTRQDTDDTASELAIAGEDSALRIYKLNRI